MTRLPMFVTRRVLKRVPTGIYDCRGNVLFMSKAPTQVPPRRLWSKCITWPQYSARRGYPTLPPFVVDWLSSSTTMVGRKNRRRGPLQSAACWQQVSEEHQGKLNSWYVGHHEAERTRQAATQVCPLLCLTTLLVLTRTRRKHPLTSMVR